MPSLLLLLSAYGLSFFVTHKFNVLDGKVGLLDRAMECQFCMGFHAGAVVFSAWNATVGHLSWFLLPLFAFASAAFSYGLDTAIRQLER